MKYLARSLGLPGLPDRPGHRGDGVPAIQENPQPDFLTMNLAGANTSAAAAGPWNPPAASATTYIGPDPQGSSNVPQYAKLRYDSVYPGIDVVYQGDNSHFRYDFQVNPGADPKVDPRSPTRAARV